MFVCNQCFYQLTLASASSACRPEDSNTYGRLVLEASPPDTIVLILYNMRGSCNYHTSFLPVVLAAFMAAFCGRGKVRNSKNAGAPCPPIAPLRPLGLLVACVSYPMLHLKAVHAKRGPSKMAAQCQSKQEQTSICVVRLPIPLSV